MQVTSEKVVSLEYTLTDATGNVLDTTQGREPLSYLHGAGHIIPGLERAIEGSSPGDSIEVTVPPPEAYGERDPRLVQAVPRERFPEETVPQVGQQFQVPTDAGPRIVTVAKVDEQAIMIDANHPLAGQTLNFDVTVADVRQATAEELQNGRIG
jgi:FKBP-type peptidyl-prolyl cis-trans isomerase SlyD